MKFVTFKRNSNTFDDIIEDTNIRSVVKTKLRWANHLQIGILAEEEKMLSYVELKYGDDIINRVCKDFSPVPFVDYLPKRPDDKNSTEPQSQDQGET